MADELLTSVEQHLKPYLNALGFSRTDYRYNPEQSSDSLIVFTFGEYRFRISSDKGKVFADVGTISDPSTKALAFDLWFVVEFLGYRHFPRDHTGSVDIQVQRIAQMVKAHWDEIFTPALLVNRVDEMVEFHQRRENSYWDHVLAQAVAGHEQTAVKVETSRFLKILAIALSITLIFSAFIVIFFYSEQSNISSTDNSQNIFEFLGSLFNADVLPMFAFYGSVIALVVFSYLSIRRRRIQERLGFPKTVPLPKTEQPNTTAAPPDPVSMYLDMRRLALEGFSQEHHGALFEIGRGSNGLTHVATVTSFASGDASLYTSTGGGIIGGGMQERVQMAARNFVNVAHKFVDKMQRVTEYPLPAVGQVRFYAIGPNGVFTVEVRRLWKVVRALCCRCMLRRRM